MAEHQYHALYWHFGPYGRRDVHLHPCTTHKGCKWEMVGVGRSCGGHNTEHAAKRLLVGSAWAKRGSEGTPLSGAPEPAANGPIGPESLPTDGRARTVEVSDRTGQHDPNLP